MLGPHGKNALIGRIAQGNADQYLEANAKYDRNRTDVLPTFVRFVIVEVISDPSVIDTAKLLYWENTLNVTNVKYASVAPRNAIIARRVMGNAEPMTENSIVLYPFFPPHLSMPAKPGEHVWAMFENQNATLTEIGYWMCRIVGPNFVEDVNYTHLDRQFDPSFAPGISDVFEGKDDPKYEFPNGVVAVKDGNRSQLAATVSIAGDEKSYENLLKDSDASKNIKYESIPRYRKRPADFVIEGSNNSLMVFGTDRVGPISNYASDEKKGKVPEANTEDDPKDDGTGMIDIVVGRGQTDKTSGKKVKNVISKFELGKSAKELVQNEGDPDLVNDRSRILISQRTKPDANFKIKNIVKEHSKGTEDGSGVGAIVIKSDKIRLIARQDLVILVTGAEDKDTDGNLKDNSESVSTNDCASITIKTDGNIVFTPSKDGIIKLGGEDADKAILCFDPAASPAAQTKGEVIRVVPMISTMGGAIGGGGVHGIHASKIMVK